MLAVSVTAARAEPITVDVFAGTRYSDNINKNEQAPVEDFEHRVGVRLSQQTAPGPCVSRFGADLAFLTYQRDTFDDRLSGTLDLDAFCQPNDYFRWNARNTLRDVRSITSQPDTPGNRERRNVFSTGPTFMWAATRLDMLLLDLEYQMTRYQRSTQDDSDRYTATTRWTRQFSRRWQGGLSASRSDIDFRRRDEELVQENISANFSRTGQNGRFSGDIGHTWITTEQGIFEGTTKGFTGGLRYDHQFEAGTGTYIEGRRTLTDRSTDIDIDIEGLELDLSQTTVVEITSVATGINHQLPQQTRVAADFSYTESDFQGAGAARQEAWRANGSVTRALRQTVNGTANLGYTQEDFDEGDGRIFHTYRSSLRLDYRQTQDLSWDAAIGLEKRDITGGTGNRYLEQWISLGVTWNLR